MDHGEQSQRLTRSTQKADTEKALFFLVEVWVKWVRSTLFHKAECAVCDLSTQCGTAKSVQIT